MGKAAEFGIGMTPLGIAMGKGPIAGALGLGGEQGEYFQAQNDNPALAQLNAENAQVGDAGFQGGLQNYVNGGISGAQAMQGLSAAQRDALMTGGDTGSRYATEQVQNNPIMGQIFGEGGQFGKDLAFQNEAMGRERDLQSQGFKLTNDDREAYGQASGDIARMFGQSENSLSQSLAQRGLSAGPSGAAAAQFSGLGGNKNEMLAKAQTDIANKRMQNTVQRIGQQQQFINQLQQNNTATGQLGNKAIGDQYGRQLSGAENRQGQLNKAAGLNIQQNAAVNEGNLQSLQDKRGAKGGTLVEGFGKGLYAGAANMGAGGGGGGSDTSKKKKNANENSSGGSGGSSGSGGGT